VDIDEFINLYSKNRLATRLDTTFHFREEESRQIAAAIEENELVIISGQAGVGKSRLALECCRVFIHKNPSFKVQCIFNRGADLFEDIRVYFSAPGDFLIFVDDANRVSGFQYIIQLLRDRKDSQRIKVIVTVRDYALDKIKMICRPYGDAFEINISPFSDAQIKQLVEKEYGIKNHHYLDRIVDISQGNPRLAIMASEIAKEKNTLESIADVSELYDEYYESIRHDLEDLENTMILKVAGTVAFFRSIDRSHKEIMTDIERVFGISEGDFWAVAKILHDKEVFDMYENEVVKVSDQVLATYLFYIVFFKEGILDFGLILSHLFPRFRQRLVDAINPVISAFNSLEIIEKMRPFVDETWTVLKNRKDKHDFLHLMEVFWFWKQTDTLLYIREEIDTMEPKPTEIANIKFASDANAPFPTVLNLLRVFKNAAVDNFSIALNLLFDYLRKQPENVPQVLQCLIEGFGFEPNSYLSGFQRQKTVIENLRKRSREGKDILFAKLFLAVAEKYLRTHFSSTKSVKPQSITIIDFDLPNTPQLKELRKTIWSSLFQLEGSLREDVLNLLYRHPRAGFEVSEKEIVGDDSVNVLQFFEKELKPSNIWHCFIVQGYLKLLSRFNLTFSPEMKERFQSETYLLYELLASDWIEEQDLKIEYEEYQQYKKKTISEYFKGYGIAEYDDLLGQCKEISKRIADKHKSDLFAQGFVTLLIALSENDASLYADVLNKYLYENDFLNVNPYFPVKCLVTSCGSEQAYKILSEPAYLSKRRWLFSYYQVLPLEEITLDHLEQLYKLFRDAKIGEFLYDLDFLLKYRSLDERIIVKVVAIILDKVGDDPNHASSLSRLFNPYSEINKEIMQIFSEDVSLLEDVYLAVDRAEEHTDFDGRTFSRILDIDPAFTDKYVDDMYKRKKWLSRYDDHRDYSFIWKCDDYEEVMSRITQRVFKYEYGEHYLSYLEVFFGIEGNWKSAGHITERQDTFLEKLIFERHDDIEFMEFLFSTIASFPTNRRCAHITIFLKHNNSFDDFKKLPLEPMMSGCSGSAVPMLQGKIDYYESLLSACKTIDLLKHRQYLEQQISYLRKEIQREKKKDFTEDYGIPLA
jgi:energy-coupling factor transporter ATP-binding protein EcfA2